MILTIKLRKKITKLKEQIGRGGAVIPREWSMVGALNWINTCNLE